ncbi:uncharacterized protein [Haliotis asinina]|uniref:uncharacterized protein n=1 Tax=Haliotis asinina TaxID=109174 RepID=UPI003531C652
MEKEVNNTISTKKSEEQQTRDKLANLASTVEGLESKSQKAEEHIEQLADRLSTTEAKASMGSSCNDDSECLVERSLCINAVCVCDPGLAYHPGKNKCVDNCTTYGQHYTSLRGYYIGNHNVQNFYGFSETQCKDACTAVTSYVCRSADLRTRDGLCSLTHESLKTVPKSFYRVESKPSIITHYSRNCLT